jgi:GNAT superfamily N-acetyltransferase
MWYRNYMEQTDVTRDAFIITLPQVGDEREIALVHRQAWKETYVGPESGLTDAKVDEMTAHLIADTTFRKNVIIEALEHPEKIFYRVVKNSSGAIVGFFHGSKNDTYNELAGVYLLREATGVGVGSKLMHEFFTWADAMKPCRLDVFTFNHAAIRFYSKFGFERTDKLIELFKGFLPNFEMVREVQGR